MQPTAHLGVRSGSQASSIDMSRYTLQLKVITDENHLIEFLAEYEVKFEKDELTIFDSGVDITKGTRANSRKQFGYPIHFVDKLISTICINQNKNTIMIRNLTFSLDLFKKENMERICRAAQNRHSYS